jgi:hypothetical protein
MADVRGVETIIFNMKNFEKSKLAKVKSAIGMTQSYISNYARSKHPYTDRTSNLTRSIQPGEITVGDDGIVGEIVANMEYAKYLEGNPSEGKLGISEGKFAFLVPALKANEGIFNDLMRKALL